jgi:hypothetical protein
VSVSPASVERKGETTPVRVADLVPLFVPADAGIV